MSFYAIFCRVNVGQDGKYMEMSFAAWAAFNIPPMILNITIAFLFLYARYKGSLHWRSSIRRSINKVFSKKSFPNSQITEDKLKFNTRDAKSYLKEEYKKLGPMSFHEYGVAIVYLLVVVLWVLRDPGFFEGLKSQIDGPGPGDSSAAMLGVLLLVIIPKDASFFCAPSNKFISATAVLKAQHTA